MITKSKIRQVGRRVARLLLLFSLWDIKDEILPVKVLGEVLFPYLVSFVIATFGIVFADPSREQDLPAFLIGGLILFLLALVATRSYRIVFKSWENLKEGVEEEKPKNIDRQFGRLIDDNKYVVVEEDDGLSEKKKRSQ